MLVGCCGSQASGQQIVNELLYGTDVNFVDLDSAKIFGNFFCCCPVLDGGAFRVPGGYVCDPLLNKIRDEDCWLTIANLAVFNEPITMPRVESAFGLFLVLGLETLSC